jgi:hypothetical protein
MRYRSAKAALRRSDGVVTSVKDADYRTRPRVVKRFDAKVTVEKRSASACAMACERQADV